MSEAGTGRSPGRRVRFVAALMAVPAVLTAVGVTGVELWRWYRPTSPLFVTPTTYSLAEAIMSDDVEAAYTFIRAGQNPSELIGVRDPVLTDGQSILVSPLVWAVATQQRDAVSMLLTFGARLDRASDRASACLADTLGNGEIAGLIRGNSRQALSHEQCPMPVASTTPLLAFIEQTQAPDR